MTEKSASTQEKSATVQEIAQNALTDEALRDKLADDLANGTRRARQQAAAAFAQIAASDASLIAPYSGVFVDALERPEAQTRWECLDALTKLVAVESRACDKAIEGAEVALFDEESGPLHLSALRFLCTLGATTETRSEKTWPLIEEAIQCWHGDLEFQDMLNAIVDFSAGKLSPVVKEQLRDRMSFDASNGRGALKRKAGLILENLS